jgi:hypothetical protein
MFVTADGVAGVCDVRVSGHWQSGPDLRKPASDGGAQHDPGPVVKP